jgi:branched-chain amino acid aminotransferase
LLAEEAGWPAPAGLVNDALPPSRGGLQEEGDMISTHPATARPQPSPTTPLGFGKFFTDHLAVARYQAPEGWGAPEIVSWSDVALDPAAAVFHYSQSMFEGLKAYRGEDGKLRVFRIDAHLKRMHDGAPRIAMPSIDVPRTKESLLALLRADAHQAPTGPGQSLYLRPLLMGTEGFLGVRPATSYMLLTMVSPVGDYFESGAKSLKLWVERTQVRAAPGGIGAVKTGANYAASVAASELAKKSGYDQVLWLDAFEHRWLEEVGTMNVFLEIGDEIVTPPLAGTILAGITRDSVLTLLRSWGLNVKERPISIDEIITASRNGQLKGMFGTGTAAVIAPIGELGIGHAERLTIPTDSPLAPRLLNTLAGMQRGTAPDPFGWIEVVG